MLTNIQEGSENMDNMREKKPGCNKTGRLKKIRLAKSVFLLLFIAFAVFFVTVGDMSTPVAAEDCDCGFCHGSNHHGDGWTGCSGCHDSPPQTGTHLTHYDSAPLNALSYGDTSVSSTSNAYRFGCGNCHPLDRSYHNDGVVEVELYNADAPADSLKAKNPPTAEYTPGLNVTAYPGHVDGQSFSYSDGTCNNVYCHSGYTVSSGSVGLPLTYPANPVPSGYTLNGSYIMDETCSNVTYAPYTVTTQRVYTTTPAWGTSGTFTTCKECHEFPLTTWAPDVQAAAGDSHQWVDDYYGYNWGHAYNMGYNGIPCATCHFETADHRPGTVGNPPTANPTYWAEVNGTYISEYYPVTLRNRAKHVNGTPDVDFDTINGYRYYWPGWRNTHVDLSSATYDPATKTCSDVGCHYGAPFGNHQKIVKWGTPNRMNEGISGGECDVCHRYGYLNETCTTP
jgi:predicted CxxxxCH...CXXCH cytochrome family protein